MFLRFIFNKGSLVCLLLLFFSSSYAGGSEEKKVCAVDEVKLYKKFRQYREYLMYEEYILDYTHVETFFSEKRLKPEWRQPDPSRMTDESYTNQLKAYRFSLKMGEGIHIVFDYEVNCLSENKVRLSLFALAYLGLPVQMVFDPVIIPKTNWS